MPQCLRHSTPFHQEELRSFLKRPKPPGFRPDDLRHTFATELPAQGAPITDVSAQLRHTKPTTTRHWYAHWHPLGDTGAARSMGRDPRRGVTSG